MKLANALFQRSELQERIRQLEGRLLNNAKVQEGEVPAEDPQELLKELEEHYAQLGEIKIRSAVNVRAMQKEIDWQAKELRELDEKIQEANWTTELME